MGQSRQSYNCKNKSIFSRDSHVDLIDLNVNDYTGSYTVQATVSRRGDPAGIAQVADNYTGSTQLTTLGSRHQLYI